MMGRTRSESNKEQENLVIKFEKKEYVEPINFNEAWNHDDEKEKHNWHKAIKKELCDMQERKKWSKVKRESK